jgi:ABC-2 family transporter protein
MVPAYLTKKMNGLKTIYYYTSHYVTFYILYIFSSVVFLISGLVAKLTFFTNTDIWVLVLIFFLWGHVQICMSFFFSTLFNRSQLAQVSVFLLVQCSVIVSLATGQIFDEKAAPMAFFIWPPFAFYRALQLINVASYDTSLRPYRISDLTVGNEVFSCIIFMVGEIFVFFMLAWYLESVLPSEFGVNSASFRSISHGIFPSLNFFTLLSLQKANFGLRMLKPKQTY